MPSKLEISETPKLGFSHRFGGGGRGGGRGGGLRCGGRSHLRDPFISSVPYIYISCCISCNGCISIHRFALVYVVLTLCRYESMQMSSCFQIVVD